MRIACICRKAKAPDRYRVLPRKDIVPSPFGHTPPRNRIGPSYIRTPNSFANKPVGVQTAIEVPGEMRPMPGHLIPGWDSLSPRRVS